MRGRARGDDRRFSRLYAHAHYIFSPAVSSGRPRASILASRQCRCSTTRQPEAHRRQARHHLRQQMARSEPRRRTDDLVPRATEADPESVGDRRRLDRAAGRHMFQSLSPAAIELGDATKADGGLTTSTGYSTRRAMPRTSSVGWLTACSARARRSTTRCCWAESRASARTPSWNQSSTPSGRGISTKLRRQTCLGDFNGYVKSIVLRINEARDSGRGQSLRLL